MLEGLIVLALLLVCVVYPAWEDNHDWSPSEKELAKRKAKAKKKAADEHYKKLISTWVR